MAKPIVTVEKGDAKDAVLITLAIEAVGSTNKIYITLDGVVRRDF